MTAFLHLTNKLAEKGHKPGQRLRQFSVQSTPDLVFYDSAHWITEIAKAPRERGEDSQYSKPGYLTGPGPVLPGSQPNQPSLEPQWVEWLAKFNHGLESTGFPFLVAITSPSSVSTVEEALYMEIGFSKPLVLKHPSYGLQILNARLMTEEMEVAIEVERQENGWFSRWSLEIAVKSVMEEGSEVG
ncbi:unnamed protein product [Arabidopsis thaliana]|uniref:(thale cress) hypothetical protein n=1 Tax=Arabidopsis thaliana TaxID=3702 RepID=A0A7G2FHY7_ARATH|nr:unnamed protein product [Arabidopsis thaliana]